MSKHAYLIIAHNKFEQLKMLCEMLDFEQNDIYIHIDAHVTDFDADSFRPALRHSKLEFAERTRVNWGGYSQIQAELNLLKAAADSGEDYSYYHLLSGADLPLRPAQEIWDFFEQRGTEFIHFSAHDFAVEERTQERAKCYHLLQEKVGRPTGWLYYLERGLVEAQNETASRGCIADRSGSALRARLQSTFCPKRTGLNLRFLMAAASMSVFCKR